jgi:hypothetical protein
VVTLSSDNRSVTVAPTSVVVTPGERSATFKVSAAPQAGGAAIISATFGGDTKTVKVTVSDPGPS